MGFQYKNLIVDNLRPVENDKSIYRLCQISLSNYLQRYHKVIVDT